MLSAAKMRTSQWSSELLTILAFWKQNLLGWLGLSPTFGKDSNGEVATKQLAAVVDVIFAHMRIRKYPISLGAQEIH